jgi:LPXTG-site transpeptidase (sortase) family protein
MVIVVTAAALLYLGLQRAHQPLAKTPPPVMNQTSPTTKDMKYGLPLRLIIPKINVDANILYMGLTPTGDMDVPADLVNVGWYKFGPHPGDKGSAVIAGHLEGVKDLGVFIDLDKLQKGDILSTLDDKGVTTTFAVRELKTYPQKDRPSEIFHSEDGAHLNLITCTGIWNNTTKRYSQRLVVFADKT